MNAQTLRIGLVGPLPPPEGGMANQCRQLATLLRSEGATVSVAQTNAPYRPAWIASWRVVRSLFRLLPFLADLWRLAGRVDVMHVFANSGWAWHLCAAPAVWIARIRGTPVIVNYRGGEAESFLARAPFWVHRTLASADSIIAPSGFLQGIFERHGLKPKTIPNIVDLTRFKPRDPTPRMAGGRHIVVTRNLEPIYDIATALRSFALASASITELRMTIAGTGPQREQLERLARELGIESRVCFAGRIDNDRIGALYREADLVLNPSTVDNMPVSILEAFASAVPVVSTNVGGIPFIARHGHTALLVPPGEPAAMSEAIVQVLSDPVLAQRLARNGLEEAKRYAWSAARELWLAEYRSHLSRTERAAEAG